MTVFHMRHGPKAVAQLARCLILTVLILSGCTTTEDVVTAPLTEGTVFEVDAPFTDTVSAAVDGLRDMGLAVKSTDARPEGVVVMTGQRMHAFSWGQVGRLFIERSEAPPIKIHVIWEKRAHFQFAGASETRIAEKLKTRIQEALLHQ